LQGTSLGETAGRRQSSSPEEDLDSKVDIIIPLEGETPLAYKLKPSKKEDDIGTKCKEDEGFVWVKTPMHEKFEKFRLYRKPRCQIH